MVNNNDAGIDDIADSLIQHLYWAKRSHVNSLPKHENLTVNLMEVEENTMQTVSSPDIDQSVKALLMENLTQPEKLKRLHRDIIGDCRRCPLCENRTQIVFGSGDPAAQLVFVGEGPGAEEDRLGEPFVGRSGQLLTKMIEAMGYSRETIYICNVVKCRPPDNRDPAPTEVTSCMPLLRAQLGIIKPKVIVTLGRYACQTLLGDMTPMSQIRGKWQRYEGIDLMPTFHPAFLLRNPSKKKEVWEDLQEVIARLKSE